jgi:hypothetical protein
MSVRDKARRCSLSREGGDLRVKPNVFDGPLPILRLLR